MPGPSRLDGPASYAAGLLAVGQGHRAIIASRKEKSVSSGNGQGSKVKHLDVQAMAGIIKHSGDFPATEELLAMCHIEEAREVLEMGCAVGFGPVHRARRHGFRVMAIHI